MPTPSQSSSKNRPLRVMAFPAFSRKSNPYNALLYNAVQKEGVDVVEFSFKNAFLSKADIVHVHWPEFFLNSHYRIKALLFSIMLLLSLGVQKLKGAKLVWTLHNLKPHVIRYPVLSGLFWWIYKRMVDGVLSLSQANLKIAQDAIPEIKHLPAGVSYHGLFECETRTIDQVDARQRLGLPVDGQIVLCLGQIKAYKGYEHLVKLAQDAKSSNMPLHIVIAGKSDEPDYIEELKQQTLGLNFDIHLGFVSDEDLPYYYKAADISVIPFNAIFNSGSALMSVSQETPVLIPHTDNFEEYAGILRGGLVTYTDLTPELVCQTIENSQFKLSNISPDVQWLVVAQETVKLYRGLLK
ncbi:MAG: glycosyltransferase family 4 protein [Pseudomonadota bacterium]|nr:glycosyltransferase family 4 protein [Pseudomonadota bacterium]